MGVGVGAGVGEDLGGELGKLVVAFGQAKTTSRQGLRAHHARADQSGGVSRDAERASQGCGAAGVDSTAGRPNQWDWDRIPSGPWLSRQSKKIVKFVRGGLYFVFLAFQCCLIIFLH